MTLSPETSLIDRDFPDNVWTFSGAADFPDDVWKISVSRDNWFCHDAFSASLHALSALIE
ncbi:MAG TPA: hypothetical protein VHC91_09175 [Trinickia sp.]|uniref:hypothetical protein n=1 Tax=Trinickia sp. TaxID=2571163 RepID=UPI002B82A7BF|nr:hypothetical protein [Trinickia sp.]HVW50555.1 hypothetical protein [Trinickia sp.]